MKIQKQSANVAITLSPEDYWIRRNTTDPDINGEWCLTHRIDMSYKGKPDQEGSVFMYLDDEVQMFMEAGFDEIM